MIIAKRNDPNDYEIEPFETYFDRFSLDFPHIPLDVVKYWMWEHNHQVVEQSEVYDFRKWKFDIQIFDNKKIIEDIKHYQYDLDRLDAKGDSFLNGSSKGYRTAEYMRKNGTFPSPIIVVNNGGEYMHALRKENMLEPFQLIEGNRRLAIIRAMIRNNYETLRESHEVWVATIED